MGLMLSYKKYKNKYFDWSGQEFQPDLIKTIPKWYKNIYNNKGHVIRREYYDNTWEEYEYNNRGYLIEYRSSSGFCEQWEYDADGKQISNKNNML